MISVQQSCCKVSGCKVVYMISVLQCLEQIHSARKPAKSPAWSVHIISFRFYYMCTTAVTDAAVCRAPQHPRCLIRCTRTKCGYGGSCMYEIIEHFFFLILRSSRQIRYDDNNKYMLLMRPEIARNSFRSTVKKAVKNKIEYIPATTTLQLQQRLKIDGS